MIRRLQLFQSRSFDPYYNLAAEQYLLERTAPGTCVLYLWQNRSTVVIGRNQNAWKECRTTLLEQEGGHLARRLSGGGAVFHDLGNLNFTFLLSAEDYDLARQLSVICRACRDLGIPAEVSGRNDVLADGRKFSGNAFYRSGGRAYHHGTLLVDVNMERMSRYLSPSRAKLEAKGVDSVRSRVVNLREFVPGLTCADVGQRMAAAFEAVYGLRAERLGPESLDGAALEALRRRNESWEWIYGPRLPFTFACEGRFSWGEIQIRLLTEAGVIRQASLCSDAMDWELVPRLEAALTGCRFTLEAMQGAIRRELPQTELSGDLCRLLAEQEI